MATDSTPELLLATSPKPSAKAAGTLARLLRKWWVAFATSSVCVVSGHLMIKAGLNALPAATAGASIVAKAAHLLLQPQIFGGLVIYLFGTVCWMRAVSQKEISFLYPLSSLNYVLVTGATVLLFQEVLSARRTAGVLVIVVGMLLMNRQRDGNNA
ncbi:MAG TPA: hypothetical protein VD837_18540 [Terriglobales bacterium]|nr:hypothetical protein [Terriglobales bacterium]